MPNITLPAVGGDENVWGQKLNNAVSILNSSVDSLTARTYTSVADAQAHLNEIPEGAQLDVLYDVG